MHLNSVDTWTFKMQKILKKKGGGECNTRIGLFTSRQDSIFSAAALEQGLDRRGMPEML